MGGRRREGEARTGPRDEERRAADVTGRWQGAGRAARTQAPRFGAQRARVHESERTSGRFQHFDSYWYAALDAAGINDFHFHDLRNTTASARGTRCVAVGDCGRARAQDPGDGEALLASRCGSQCEGDREIGCGERFVIYKVTPISNLYAVQGSRAIRKGWRWKQFATS